MFFLEDRIRIQANSTRIHHHALIYPSNIVIFNFRSTEKMNFIRVEIGSDPGFFLIRISSSRIRKPGIRYWSVGSAAVVKYYYNAIDNNVVPV